MKRILLLSLTVFFYIHLRAQNVFINTTGDPAAPSAMLDISSTDKGILVPRMAGFQRAMIINPAQGLLVYDTDSRSFWYYDGAWNELAGGMYHQIRKLPS
jgi:trimeric autotransporter adhesin